MTRRRSLTVVAPLVAATALSLTTGCKQKEMQRCVDEHDNVVADSYCQANGQQPVQQPQPQGGVYVGHPVFIPTYRWYYGGGGGYNIGDHVMGGGYAPLAGHSYGSPSVTRGGFGSTFSSHGSGE